MSHSYPVAIFVVRRKWTILAEGIWSTVMSSSFLIVIQVARLLTRNPTRPKSRPRTVKIVNFFRLGTSQDKCNEVKYGTNMELATYILYAVCTLRGHWRKNPQHVHPADMAGFASCLSVLDTKNFKLSQQMQGTRTKRTKQLWNDKITLYSSVRMYEDYKRRVSWFMDVKSNSPKTFSNNNRCPQDNN